MQQSFQEELLQNQVWAIQVSARDSFKSMSNPILNIQLLFNKYLVKAFYPCGMMLEVQDKETPLPWGNVHASERPTLKHGLH